jgi:lauroyl/myristoyl acyltransferase
VAEGFANSTAETREAATFAALIDAARRRQQAAYEKSPLTPRFLLESAQSMAAHMGMSEQRMQDCLALMALWQLYLQSALGASTWDFAAVREHMPCSYERVRVALAAMESRPQVVSTVFHMAAFPLICVLIGTVWRDMHHGPLHLLVASRNMGWFRLGSNRWVRDEIEVVNTDAAGLRQLVAGLRNGSIRRLLILVDGPQAPGRPGARALNSVSPTLGIKTTLVSMIHRMGIPLVPVTHEWGAGGLLVTPCPLLDPAILDEAETMNAVVRHIEDLLRRHPEQWMNWNGARIRT